MKAFEIDKGLKVKDPSAPDDDEDQSYYIPPSQIPAVKAFEEVGLQYERTVHDRVWNWFVNLVTAEPVKDQEIKMVIPQLYRTKDPDGKEWLFYNCELSGRDWKGNRKDFSYLEGVIEGVQLFNYEIDPSTEKVISGTTQVMEVQKKYNIPFTKAKVDEISKHFKHPVHCIIVNGDGRKYSVTLEQFKSLSFQELIDMVTGYADFMKNRRGTKVYS